LSLELGSAQTGIELDDPQQLRLTDVKLAGA